MTRPIRATGKAEDDEDRDGRSGHARRWAPRRNGVGAWPVAGTRASGRRDLEDPLGVADQKTANHVLAETQFGQARDEGVEHVVVRYSGVEELRIEIGDF